MNLQVAVIIPTYKACPHILNVIDRIGSEVCRIYVIDDFCPDGSGDHLIANCKDERVVVIKHCENLGVGGAVMTGYRAAIEDGMSILVKIDSDEQMDPALIQNFITPIIEGEADYTKGNRFFDLENLKSMPKIRLLGNAVLSLMCKISSGYWNIFDPTNGYTAIHANVARHLPFDKISRRYFFETDMLFRLNIIRAVVVDVPMESKYGNEISNLKIYRVLGEFFVKHIRNFFKENFLLLFSQRHVTCISRVADRSRAFLFWFDLWCFSLDAFLEFWRLYSSRYSDVVRIADSNRNTTHIGFCWIRYSFSSYSINLQKSQ